VISMRHIEALISITKWNIMSLGFRGTFLKLRKYVSRVDSRGHWRDLKYHCKQYRTDDGGVLNWWKKSGKILFQGHGQGASKFEQALIAVFEAKGRLKRSNCQSPADLKRDNETLRTIIADILLESARLRRRLLTEQQSTKTRNSGG